MVKENEKVVALDGVRFHLAVYRREDYYTEVQVTAIDIENEDDRMTIAGQLIPFSDLVDSM